VAQHRYHRRATKRWSRFGAVVATGALLAGTLVAAGASPAAAQKTGGEVRFGLEAESTGGFCISQAQLAISGIQVAAAMYDTLTAPNTKGEYVPNLAESVTSNPTFTEWTIKLRPNIKFHNGEPLNADAVKLNIDSWRGANPNLPARLFLFVYNNIADVQKVDDLTVKVVTKTPWAAFPSYLYLVGRAGIMAPAQINSPATCATNMIGTGPFKLNNPGDWKVNESLTVNKNPEYWKKDAKGNQLPYLDRITFVPVVDSPTRDTQLQGGQLDLMHTSSAQSIDRLQTVPGVTETTEKAGNRDVRYYLVNTSRPPFDNADARLALAYALNVPEINTIRNK
jgi:peptide/nickel transport system substrate-binding protein